MLRAGTPDAHISMTFTLGGLTFGSVCLQSGGEEVCNSTSDLQGAFEKILYLLRAERAAIRAAAKRTRAQELLDEAEKLDPKGTP